MRELLKLAEMPRSTFYYHLNNLKKEDKYKVEKDEILSIFHENKGRYGYRRITLEMRNRGYVINHKTVWIYVKFLDTFFYEFLYIFSSFA